MKNVLKMPTRQSIFKIGLIADIAVVANVDVVGAYDLKEAEEKALSLAGEGKVTWRYKGGVELETIEVAELSETPEAGWVPFPDNEPLQHVAKDGEILWFHSMGKRFQVRAIFTSDEASNAWMEKHRDCGLIAEFGPFRIIANLYAGEKA